MRLKSQTHRFDFQEESFFVDDSWVKLALAFFAGLKRRGYCIRLWLTFNRFPPE
jgi:hypothetical protein